MKIIESDFEYRGYRCVTIFHDGGFRCGYVGLPEGHPLYKKDYKDQINVTLKDIVGTPVGKRGVFTLLGLPDNLDDQINMDAYFDVHGGLTFSAGGKNSHHPVDSDLWWLGFDCGHAGDCPDYELLEKLWGNDRLVKSRLGDRWLYEEDEVRDLAYVQQECKNLVDQIIDLVNKYYKVMFDESSK